MLSSATQHGHMQCLMPKPKANANKERKCLNTRFPSSHAISHVQCAGYNAKKNYITKLPLSSININYKKCIYLRIKTAYENKKIAKSFCNQTN